MKNKSLLSTFFFLTILLFLGSLSWLAIGENTISGRNVLFDFSSTENENRSKAPFPNSFNWTFSDQFDAYFKDSFPLRPFLIKNAQKLKKRIKDSPKVILGLDGWIYFNPTPESLYAKSENSLGDFTGKTLLNTQEKELFTQNLRCQKAFFDKNKIDWYIMTPPNKMEIYSEFLTSPYLSQRASFTRYDQVEEILKDLNIGIISLKKPLLDAKNQEAMYLQTDTHWTELGGYIGFLELARVLKFKIPKIDSIERKPITCGDIHLLSATVSKKCVDFQVTPVFKQKDTTSSCVTDGRYKKIVCTNTKPFVNKNVLLIRDSFTTNMQPYFAQSFKKATSLWRSMYSEQELFDAIKENKPDIVIYETQERYILENQNTKICPNHFVPLNRLNQRSYEEAPAP